MRIPNNDIFKIMMLVMVFIAASCNDSKNESAYIETAFKASKGAKAADNSKPLTINLALNETYAKKTACVCVQNIAAREYDELQSMLKSKFNIDLKIKYFVETYDMEDELIKKEFDGVICKPWTAYMLAPKYKINYKRIADILDPSGNQWLTGLFMVRVKSDIRSLADINGKTLVTGQPDAYEKYHSPMAILSKQKIHPGKIYDKASCLECINELMDEKTDVAVVSDYTMCASCAVDVANPDDFRIIAKTEEMPLASVILDMDRISEAEALRFQQALLACSGKNSPESMLSAGFVLPAKWIPQPYVKNEK